MTDKTGIEIMNITFLGHACFLIQGSEDAARAVELLRPSIAIPMHLNTWDIIHQDPNEFARQVTNPGTQVVILDIGKSMEL